MVDVLVLVVYFHGFALGLFLGWMLWRRAKLTYASIASDAVVDVVERRGEFTAKVETDLNVAKGGVPVATDPQQMLEFLAGRIGCTAICVVFIVMILVLLVGVIACLFELG